MAYNVFMSYVLSCVRWPWELPGGKVRHGIVGWAVSHGRREAQYVSMQVSDFTFFYFIPDGLDKYPSRIRYGYISDTRYAATVTYPSCIDISYLRVFFCRYSGRGLFLDPPTVCIKSETCNVSLPQSMQHYPRTSGDTCQ